MGLYFNPLGRLPDVCRCLKSKPRPSFDELTLQLQEDECLFGLYDRFSFKNAVFLPDADGLAEFENQVRCGMIGSLGFYAMSKEAFVKYFGEGVWEREVLR